MYFVSRGGQKHCCKSSLPSLFPLFPKGHCNCLFLLCATGKTKNKKGFSTPFLFIKSVTLLKKKTFPKHPGTRLTGRNTVYIGDSLRRTSHPTFWVSIQRLGTSVLAFLSLSFLSLSLSLSFSLCSLCSLSSLSPVLHKDLVWSP